MPNLTIPEFNPFAKWVAALPKDASGNIVIELPYIPQPHDFLAPAAEQMVKAVAPVAGKFASLIPEVDPMADLAKFLAPLQAVDLSKLMPSVDISKLLPQAPTGFTMDNLLQLLAPFKQLISVPALPVIALPPMPDMPKLPAMPTLPSMPASIDLDFGVKDLQKLMDILKPLMPTMPTMG
eukprot:jgi/Chrzof1/6039/Cz17g03100.t1